MSARSDPFRLVLQKLSKLEGERKSFQLVNGVLVQQTVEESVPEVQGNMDALEKLIDQMTKNLKSKEAEVAAYKKKYGIRTQQEAQMLEHAEQRKAQLEAGK